MNQIISFQLNDNHQILVPPSASKDARHRLTTFATWLEAQGASWQTPDLAAYRDYLLAERGLSPASATAHLSTIRGRYQALLRDNAAREALYALTPADASPADRKAFVDEALQRLENAIHPRTAPVKVVVKQDRRDDEHLRLTREQANDLLAAPGVATLVGLRDTALIALMLCTGIREAELCALNVADLRQRLGGSLALYIREGKGAKERLVPYGQLEWCLAILDAWLGASAIGSDAVFRAFWKGNQRLRTTRLTVRAVQQILDKYPVMIDGLRRTVNPHDLRRTYARRLYDAGVDLVAIQQNLGHADSKTTLGYIGMLDAGQRRPPAVYNFDLSRLNRRTNQAPLPAQPISDHNFSTVGNKDTMGRTRSQPAIQKTTEPPLTHDDLKPFIHKPLAALFDFLASAFERRHGKVWDLAGGTLYKNHLEHNAYEIRLPDGRVHHFGPDRWALEKSLLDYVNTGTNKWTPRRR